MTQAGCGPPTVSGVQASVYNVMTDSFQSLLFFMVFCFWHYRSGVGNNIKWLNYDLQNPLLITVLQLHALPKLLKIKPHVSCSTADFKDNR